MFDIIIHMSLKEKLRDLKRKQLEELNRKRQTKLENKHRERLRKQRESKMRRDLESRIDLLFAPILGVTNDDWLGGRGEITLNDGCAMLRWNKSPKKSFRAGDVICDQISIILEADEIAVWGGGVGYKPIPLSDSSWKDKVEGHIVEILETGRTKRIHHEPMDRNWN